MTDHPAWRSPLHTIRAAIAYAVTAQPLRQPALAIIDAIQFAHPSVQMDALFTTAVAMAQTLNLDPHEMVARAKRILPSAEGPFSEQFSVVRDYAGGELRK